MYNLHNKAIFINLLHVFHFNFSICAFAYYIWVSISSHCLFTFWCPFVLVWRNEESTWVVVSWTLLGWEGKDVD